jgi:threonylcarbamoyladenosine tRNA methylthiotransferase MtaB
MRRWHTREAYRARMLKIAGRIRPLGLGADVIAGFPGETADDHATTRELVEELPYSYLHVFPWSPREGTVAASLDGRVPQRVAAERARELRELAIAAGRNYVAGRIGEAARVAVETAATGLTGDYLRVRVVGEPGTLIDAVLTGTEDALRADAAGRRALPVVTAAV